MDESVKGVVRHMEEERGTPCGLALPLAGRWRNVEALWPGGRRSRIRRREQAQREWLTGVSGLPLVGPGSGSTNLRCHQFRTKRVSPFDLLRCEAHLHEEFGRRIRFSPRGRTDSLLGLPSIFRGLWLQQAPLLPSPLLPALASTTATPRATPHAPRLPSLSSFATHARGSDLLCNPSARWNERPNVDGEGVFPSFDGVAASSDKRLRRWQHRRWWSSQGWPSFTTSAPRSAGSRRP